MDNGLNLALDLATSIALMRDEWAKMSSEA